MKTLLKILLLVVFSLTANAQNNSIQLAPFSVETVKYLTTNHHLKASLVYRIFYERNLSNHFSTIGGMGFLNNTVSAPRQWGGVNPITFHQKQFEVQLGLKFSIFKNNKLLNPFIEQAFFYKVGSQNGPFSEIIFNGNDFKQSSIGKSFGTRTRIGLDVKISPHFFASFNSAISLGIGDIVYEYSEALFVDKYYGTNFILSEFRIGYRF